MVHHGVDGADQFTLYYTALFHYIQYITIFTYTRLLINSPSSVPVGTLCHVTRRSTDQPDAWSWVSARRTRVFAYYFAGRPYVTCVY